MYDTNFTFKMESLYVLELANGKYYVGKTFDVEERFKRHMSGNGPKWTKLHRPIAIIEQRPCTSDTAEDELTKEYRDKYGAANVRGGTYMGMYSSEFVREWFKGKVQKDSTCASKNLCYNCHKPGHFTKECVNEPAHFCSHCGADFETEDAAFLHEKTCS